MKDPAIVFYTSDFMVGVSNLIMEERGQYITLLCLQHQLGHLSEKTIKLNVPNVSEDVLSKFIIDENGNYYNVRLENEIIKRSKFIEHQRENGKKGGRPKKEENPKETQIKPNNKPKEKPLEDEDDNENINDNIYSYIESNFNRLLSPIEYELVSTWEDNELTRYAIKEAVLNGARSLKYVQAILNNWKDKGITTIPQAQKKKTPTWLNEEIEQDLVTPEEEAEFRKRLESEVN